MRDVALKQTEIKRDGTDTQAAGRPGTIAVMFNSFLKGATS